VQSKLINALVGVQLNLEKSPSCLSVIERGWSWLGRLIEAEIKDFAFDGFSPWYDYSLNVCRNVCVMPGGGLKTGADQIM